MTQFRYTKEGEKLLNAVYRRTEEETYADVINNIPFDARVDFIRLLDEDSEDWGITEQLFLYFAEQIMLEDAEIFDSGTIEIINRLNDWRQK